ncbi:MAG: hypothetical protein ABEJ07_03460 [Candidatus Nanohaloarchaea archaeon]
MVDRSKGIGYSVEAFVAILTLFVFAIGSLQSPPSHDWSRFQGEVAAKDITYVLQKTGNMDAFLQRGETGSLRTAASTLAQGRLEASGSVQNLPIGEKVVGFHVLQTGIHDIRARTATSLGDRCATSNDLEEINSENDVMRTVSERHGVHLYVADIDPSVPGGFNGEEDYDAVWVDNGTRCQFSAAEGPILEDRFYWWGNRSDAETDLHYDLKDISKDGEKLLVYEAEQPARFRTTIRKNINGIRTDTGVDTFNFSTTDLSDYDTLVFRREASLDLINADSDREQRVMEYLDDGSALFLVDLEESDLSSGFMARTGLRWKDPGWTLRPFGASFSETPRSRRAENLFLGQSGSKNAVDMLPGGNITSGQGLAYARSARLRTDNWNATDMSMTTDSAPPPGVPESGCGNYRQGSFPFPGSTYDGWSSELGDCSDAEEVWALSLDTSGNGRIEQDEKTYANGDTLTVEDRKYTAKIYPASGSCSPGECAEFVYAGSDRIEIVNSRTEFEDTNIERFARAGYETSYSEEDRKLLTSVLYWLNGEQNSFGQVNGRISTTSVGGIKNQVYMPYRIDMRWEQ